MSARRPTTPRGLRRMVAAAGLLALAACSSAPPAPDWQANAKGALERGLEDYLQGDTQAAEQAFDAARREIARTGRLDLMARAELMRCAAQVASLEFGPCAAFEPLRADAGPAERAYADHLAGRALTPTQIDSLPPAQRAAARNLAQPDPGPAGAVDSDDPQSRLIATALLFQAGRASPALIGQAAATASARGWRRPLLAWLEVQRRHADDSGQTDAAQQLRRRIERVRQGR